MLFYQPTQGIILGKSHKLTPKKLHCVIQVKNLHSSCPLSIRNSPLMREFPEENGTWAFGFSHGHAAVPAATSSGSNGKWDYHHIGYDEDSFSSKHNQNMEAWQPVRQLR